MSTKTDAPRLTWELLVSRQAGGWCAVLPLSRNIPHFRNSGNAEVILIWFQWDDF